MNPLSFIVWTGQPGPHGTCRIQGQLLVGKGVVGMDIALRPEEPFWTALEEATKAIRFYLLQSLVQ